MPGSQPGDPPVPLGALVSRGTSGWDPGDPAAGWWRGAGRAWAGGVAMCEHRLELRVLRVQGGSDAEGACRLQACWLI